MVGNRSIDTAPELALRRELHRRGLRFRVHRQVLPELRCRPDVTFGPTRVAVFVMGCFWHRCPEHATTPKANRNYWKNKFARTVTRDAHNREALERAGWLVVWVWEHESVGTAAERVEQAVRERAGVRRSDRTLDYGGTR
jgi:DNA mismatch endonuclease (patch repair protein)